MNSMRESTLTNKVLSGLLETRVLLTRSTCAGYLWKLSRPHSNRRTPIFSSDSRPSSVQNASSGNSAGLSLVACVSPTWFFQSAPPPSPTTSSSPSLHSPASKAGRQTQKQAGETGNAAMLTHMSIGPPTPVSLSIRKTRKGTREDVKARRLHVGVSTQVNAASTCDEKPSLHTPLGEPRDDESVGGKPLDRDLEPAASAQSYSTEAEHSICSGEVTNEAVDLVCEARNKGQTVGQTRSGAEIGMTIAEAAPPTPTETGTSRPRSKESPGSGGGGGGGVDGDILRWHVWRRRWFCFDRQRRLLVYYYRHGDTKIRGRQSCCMLDALSVLALRGLWKSPDRPSWFRRYC
ncbi:unnamed protein product [Protopolystoma xenopodis]|uniref:PH domain-containing protein n=1 Tax=Protopolystoma xenopodis TaxID=117903 RepID=A0A3S5CDD4_9PLAT|nr:unnamed protein product [Protopolystoma xenopodis]